MRHRDIIATLVAIAALPLLRAAWWVRARFSRRPLAASEPKIFTTESAR